MVGGTSRKRLPLPTRKDLAVAAHAWQELKSSVELDRGSIWHRVIAASSVAEARYFASHSYASTSLNRFTPLRDEDGVLASAYAASTEQIALWEVVLRGIRHEGLRRIPTSAVRDRYIIEVELTRAMRALSIRRPQDAFLVAPGKRPPDLTAAWPHMYGKTRAWAQALYDHIPGLDGILYESHQVAGDCIVLIQPSDSPIFEVRAEPEPLVREPVRSLLASEALSAGAVVDFGDDDDDDDA